jgi:hypothetical protein
MQKKVQNDGTFFRQSCLVYVNIEQEWMKS